MKTVLIALTLIFPLSSFAQNTCNQFTINLQPNAQCYLQFRNVCDFNGMATSCEPKAPSGNCKKVATYVDSQCAQALFSNETLVRCLNMYSNPLAEKVNQLCETKVYSCQVQ